MPTEEKNSVQNEPPRMVGGVIVFVLIILGLIFFRGIYGLETKFRSLGVFVPLTNADVPGGGDEGGDEGAGCEADSESGEGCEGEGEGEGE